MSDDFWDAAEPLMATGELHEGTIMSSACVRDGTGGFVAMPNHQGDGMVVKLPRERVQALIDEGVGQPFAPANRVFKEWVLVDGHIDTWPDLLCESLAFVHR